MNPFFAPGGEPGDVMLPQRAYGKVDHIELNHDTGATYLTMDIVDANWFDAQNHLQLENYGRKPARRLMSRDGILRPTSPFDSAPLFRLEFELDSNEFNTLFGVGCVTDSEASDRFQAIGDQWLLLNLSARKNTGAPCLAYAGLNAIPTQVYTNGKLPSKSAVRALNKVFNLSSFTKISESQLSHLLSKCSASHLAVYDVGQGNCNALLDDDYFPTLYYDLGAGVFGNSASKPLALRFCMTRSPYILLSHWDADHWAGAFATQVNGSYPALAREWIAPLQPVTVVHFVFATEINRYGRLRLIDTASGQGFTNLRTGQALRYWRGVGHDKNASGIVLDVMDPQKRASWLLTGDCDYTYFPSLMHPLVPMAIVAPHHGAKLHAAAKVPPPYSTAFGAYRRLIYSFGADNQFGKTKKSHPNAESVLKHHQAGWLHATNYLTAPGCEIHGGNDARGTAAHAPSVDRNGILVGWSEPQQPMQPACGARHCVKAGTD